METNNFKDYKKPKELNGKTIETCEIIRSEFGRTCNSYLLIKFTDNTRQLIGIDAFDFYSPDPDVEEMKKAPLFFSVEDICEKVKRDEQDKRDQQKALRKNKINQLKKLQEELGIKD